MLSSSLALILPLLLTASAHPNPHFNGRLEQRLMRETHQRYAQAARDINVGAQVGQPKGHFGIPPAQDALELLHSGNGLGPKKMVRRKKRSCTAGSGSKNNSTTTPPSTINDNNTGGGSASNGTSSSGGSGDNSPSSASAPIVASSTAANTAAASSAAAPSPSASQPSNSTGSSGSGSSGAMSAIFPVGSGTASWTTDSDASGAMSFDSALKPLTAGKLPPTANAPDGSNAMQVTYPQGIVGLKNGGGMNFYTEGNANGVNVEGASEVMFTYSVFFPDGFDFVKGGKLPGVYGGTSLEASKTCSGGRQDDRGACFSARTMWRTNGMGEIYNYLPPGAQDANPGYCSIAPQSLCNPDYGDSIGRGAFTFPTGAWTTVAQRFKMNDMGQSNGEQELYINGESKIHITDMAYAQEQGTKIYGIMSQSFFGGSGSDWAPPSDMTAYFKDWSLAVLA